VQTNKSIFFGQYEEMVIIYPITRCSEFGTGLIKVTCQRYYNFMGKL